MREMPRVLNKRSDEIPPDAVLDHEKSTRREACVNL